MMRSRSAGKAGRCEGRLVIPQRAVSEEYTKNDAADGITAKYSGTEDTERVAAGEARDGR